MQWQAPAFPLYILFNCKNSAIFGLCFINQQQHGIKLITSDLGQLRIPIQKIVSLHTFWITAKLSENKHALQVEIKKSIGQVDKWGSEGKKKTNNMTAQQLAAVILSTTEELKISALKKMTKSLRDQADRDYRKGYRGKKQQ